MFDAHFGRLLDDFDLHDLWADTALIVTTDHGFLPGRTRLVEQEHPPYSEEISHIPLMVHLPGRPELAGTRTEMLTQTPDLMPTILDLHGAAIPPQVRARSMLSPAAEGRVAVFGQFGEPIGVSDGQDALYLYSPKTTPTNCTAALLAWAT